ncbi:MAG: FYDLN acid domain-containing protein [Holophagales bacterium]|jgi:hypothetical protein|nr:MAG: FYDLN acid domain-containing protein [Holophagales bacterium]
MPELGNKWECFSCGVKFYDLGRHESICPKCGANQKDAKAAEIASEALAAAKRKRREDAVLRALDEPDELIPDADFDADDEDVAAVAEEIDEEEIDEDE